MEHKLNNTIRKAALATLIALVALTAGCGDGFFTRPGGMINAALSKQIRERMGGAEVDVLEYTGCQVVNSSDAAARCQGVSETEIEIFVDGQSIIFDFSNVAKGGKISEAGFEGYVVSVADESRVPPILEAVVDAVKSSIGSKDVAVEFDDKNIAVNFQGLDFDETTFIKVDLVFDQAS